MRRKALDRLAALAKENGISRAAVLELLVRCGKWLNPPMSERTSPEMTRPLDKPSLRTANEAMRHATVVEDVYVALMWRDLEDIPNLIYSAGAHREAK